MKLYNELFVNNVIVDPTIYRQQSDIVFIMFYDSPNKERKYFPLVPLHIKTSLPDAK